MSSGKGMARAVSVIGLALVWGLIWANLPSQDDLLSAYMKPALAVPPAVPELDLTIPGVPLQPSSRRLSFERASSTRSVTADPAGVHARQVAEVKCEAEVQQVCPESLTGEARRRCVESHVKKLAPACQAIVRQRLVRWKEAEGYNVACLDDVQRMCPTVQPGDGRILQCLQDHAQDVSDVCYQSLPKGQLLLRR